MYIKNDGSNAIFSVSEDLNMKQIFAHPFILNINRNAIIKMRNDNVITDRDLQIVKFLYQFKFATADQLKRLLGTVGETDHVNIETRLEKLVQYRVLNAFCLGNEHEIKKIPRDAVIVYCLDLGGRYLLANFSNEDVTDWYSGMNMKSANLIGKSLLATHFYIRLQETCPNNVSHFKVEPEMRVGVKSVIPTFEMSMTINGLKRYMIGEVVREYDYPVYFRDKAFKLESLLTTKAWMKYYSDGVGEPILFLFTQNDMNAYESAKMLHEATGIPHFRLTTDERMEKTLYEAGAFLKYLPESDNLQQIRAVTFEP